MNDKQRQQEEIAYEIGQRFATQRVLRSLTIPAVGNVCGVRWGIQPTSAASFVRDVESGHLHTLARAGPNSDVLLLYEQRLSDYAGLLGWRKLIAVQAALAGIDQINEHLTIRTSTFGSPADMKFQEQYETVRRAVDTIYRHRPELLSALERCLKDLPGA